MIDGRDESDVASVDLRLMRRKRSPSRSAIYFSEVNVMRSDRIAHVQSVEDISSGYSSGEGLYAAGQVPKLQAREGLVRAGSLKARVTRVTRSSAVIHKKPASVSEESDDESEVFDTNVIFLNDQARKLTDLDKAPSSSEEEFVDSVDSVMHDRPPLILKEVHSINNSHVEKGELTACPPDRRGGKYHKKAAPRPPPAAGYKSQVGAIKATLVLKPGVVKPLETPNSECKEVFVHSPKSRRRRTNNRSPSSARSKSPSTTTLSKLIKLPKMIGFWNKDLSLPSLLGSNNNNNKRSSWHADSSNRLSLKPDSKIQSKSDNDLTKTVSQAWDKRKDGMIVRSSSRFSTQTLTESPLAKRRLKIIRRYVDEDID